jgi:hypothetical protein
MNETAKKKRWAFLMASLMEKMHPFLLNQSVQELCLALERSGIFPDGFLDTQIWHYFLLNQALF